MRHKAIWAFIFKRTLLFWMTTGTRRRRINCSQLDSSTFPVPTVCPSQFSVRDRWNICHYVSSGAEWKVARNRTETNRAGPARVGTWKMEAPRPTAGYEVSQMEKRDIGNVSNLLLCDEATRFCYLFTIIY